MRLPLNALRHLQREQIMFYFAFQSRPAGSATNAFFTSGVAEENSICSLKALFYHYDPSREKAFQPSSAELWLKCKLK